MKLITGLLMMFLSTLAFAQVGVSVNAERGFASNIFSNYKQTPDYFNRLEAQFNFDSIEDSQGLRAYYKGSGTLFQKFDYKSFQTHGLGLSYFSYLSENGDRLNAGLNASTRLHSADYKYYEYQQGDGFANVKVLLQPQTFGYAGVSFRSRNYSSLSPYSYWQGMAYMRASRFFNSGTTLIAEVVYMQKQYLDANPGNKELAAWLDAALAKFDEIYSNSRPGFLEGYKALKEAITPWGA